MTFVYRIAEQIILVHFYLTRFEFYKQAKESFVVVHTGETALYGNIILQKGVIAPQ